jgi:hypothetical protein
MVEWHGSDAAGGYTSALKGGKIPSSLSAFGGRGWENAGMSATVPMRDGKSNPKLLDQVRDAIRSQAVQSADRAELYRSR